VIRHRHPGGGARAANEGPFSKRHPVLGSGSQSGFTIEVLPGAPRRALKGDPHEGGFFCGVGPENLPRRIPRLKAHPIGQYFTHEPLTASRFRKRPSKLVSIRFAKRAPEEESNRLWRGAFPHRRQPAGRG
jgi:hypothetical protein